MRTAENLASANAAIDKATQHVYTLWCYALLSFAVAVPLHECLEAIASRRLAQCHEEILQKWLDVGGPNGTGSSGTSPGPGTEMYGGTLVEAPSRALVPRKVNESI